MQFYNFTILKNSIQNKQQADDHHAQTDDRAAENAAQLDSLFELVLFDHALGGKRQRDEHDSQNQAGQRGHHHAHRRIKGGKKQADGNAEHTDGVDNQKYL